jgi:hypothetical protein
VEHWNRRFAGKRLSVRVRDGYKRVKILQRDIYLHRVVWALHNGEWPKHSIDHINSDPSDNRIENLRDIPLSENIRARFIRQRGDHVPGPHHVRVRTPFGRVYVGSFQTEELAAAAFRGAHSVIDAIRSTHSPLAPET